MWTWHRILNNKPMFVDSAAYGNQKPVLTRHYIVNMQLQNHTPYLRKPWWIKWQWEWSLLTNWSWSWLLVIFCASMVFLKFSSLPKHHLLNSSWIQIATACMCRDIPLLIKSHDLFSYLCQADGLQYCNLLILWGNNSSSARRYLK